MTYEEAAQIALASAQRDGLTRWVYRAQATPGDREEWRVTISWGDVGQGTPTAVILPQARAIPEKPS